MTLIMKYKIESINIEADLKHIQDVLVCMQVSDEQVMLTHTDTGEFEGFDRTDPLYLLKFKLCHDVQNIYEVMIPVECVQGFTIYSKKHAEFALYLDANSRTAQEALKGNFMFRVVDDLPF